MLVATGRFSVHNLTSRPLPLPSSPPTSGSTPILFKDAAQLFDLANHGQQVAKQIADNALDCLAITIANAVLLINPECVVLGGVLAMAGDLLVTPLRERVTRLLAIEAPNIVLSRFIFDAPLVGASALAAELATDRLVRELEGKADGPN